jgi:hypothetical protein
VLASSSGPLAKLVQKSLDDGHELDGVVHQIDMAAAVLV